MNYYRVIMNCRVTNTGTCSEKPKGSHIAGRHIFTSAESETEAVEKAKYRYKNEHDTKIIRAEKVDFIPDKRSMI